MRYLRCIFAFGLTAFGLIGHLAAQSCETVYIDSSTLQDPNTGKVSLWAWNTLSDEKTDPSSPCYVNIGLNYTHTYNTSVQITSPSGRTATGNGYGTMGGGYGEGVAQANIEFDLGCDPTDPNYPDDCDFGDYTVAGPVDTGECSFMGLFFSGGGGSGPSIRVGIAVSTFGFYQILGNGSCQYVLACPNGNEKATCQSGPVSVPSPCPYNYLSTAFIYVKKTSSLSCFGFGPAKFSDVAVNCQ